jgi:Domain of unknown function (DUF5916)
MADGSSSRNDTGMPVRTLIVGILARIVAIASAGPTALPPLASLPPLAQLPSSALTYDGRAGHITVDVPRFDQSATIDGALDEPVWKSAAVLTGFSQFSPIDGRAAQDSTAVLVWYSPTAIYFGIRAYESHGRVHATLANRDQIDADDNVEIILSTFHDGRQAYVFAVNPLGVQEDGTMTEGRPADPTGPTAFFNGRPPLDLAPDFVYESKGRITSFGYQVEVRIPLKSLKYQSALKQDWGINIIRKTQYSGYEDSWTPASRAGTSFLGQSGTLAGLSGLRRGVVLDVTPIVTEKAIGDRGTGRTWRYAAGLPQFGGNLRYGVSQNLTLNGTFRPDFAEVESDAVQLVFDPRQAVFFPEKRPFFLDGIEQFATPNIPLIYTRRIVAPVAAAKLTGTIAGMTAAFLTAEDDKSNSLSGTTSPLYTFVRVQRDVAPGSQVGVVATDREDGGDFNRVGGVDARLAFASVYTLTLQAVSSSSRTAQQSTSGPFWHADLFHNGRSYRSTTSVEASDPQFKTASGFISETGVADAYTDHNFILNGPPHALIESTDLDVNLAGHWLYRQFTDAQQVQNKFLHFNSVTTLHGGWVARASVFLEQYAYDPSLYTGYYLGHVTGHDTTYTPFVGGRAIPNTDYLMQVTTPGFAHVSGSVSYLFGRDEDFFEWAAANVGFLTLTADWRPTSQLRAELQYNLQQYHRHTDGTTVSIHRVPRLRVEYQVSRALFVRVIGQYDAGFQDSLRDESRTNLPIFTRTSTANYVPAAGFAADTISVQWLLAYQPVPGTVFFAGYGNGLTEPESFHFNALRRTTDSFFVKLSYLFRM